MVFSFALNLRLFLIVFKLASLHFFDISERPGLLKDWFIGSVKPEEEEKSLAGWDPIFIKTFWRFWSKIYIDRSVLVFLHLVNDFGG